MNKVKPALHTLRRRLTAALFLPVGEDHHVSLSLLTFKRGRLMMVLSLALNLVLLVGLINAAKRQRVEQRFMAHVQHLGETSRTLAELYGAQLTDLASAYTCYAQAGQTDDQAEKTRLAERYQTSMQRFNQRSAEMEHHAHRLRETLNALTPKAKDDRHEL
jgi:hypothetical protein